MMRSVKTWLVPAVVALLAAVPFSTGCNDNGPTGGTITTDLVATYEPEIAPAAASVTLQAGDAAVSTDTINLEIVVTEVDDVFGVGFTVSYKALLLQFEGADFTGSFLTGGLLDPDTEFFSGTNADNVNGYADVVATRVGDDLGGVSMDVGEQGVLGVLTFRVIQPISSPSDLVLEDMDVTVCEAGGLCSQVDVTVGGGSVTAQ